MLFDVAKAAMLPNLDGQAIHGDEARRGVRRRQERVRRILDRRGQPQHGAGGDGSVIDEEPLRRRRVVTPGSHGAEFATGALGGGGDRVEDLGAEGMRLGSGQHRVDLLPRRPFRKEALLYLRCLRTARKHGGLDVFPQGPGDWPGFRLEDEPLCSADGSV